MFERIYFADIQTVVFDNNEAKSLGSRRLRMSENAVSCHGKHCLRIIGDGFFGISILGLILRLLQNYQNGCVAGLLLCGSGKADPMNCKNNCQKIMIGMPVEI